VHISFLLSSGHQLPVEHLHALPHEACCHWYCPSLAVVGVSLFWKLVFRKTVTSKEIFSNEVQRAESSIMERTQQHMLVSNRKEHNLEVGILFIDLALKCCV